MLVTKENTENYECGKTNGFVQNTETGRFEHNVRIRLYANVSDRARIEREAHSNVYMYIIGGNVRENNHYGQRQ